MARGYTILSSTESFYLTLKVLSGKIMLCEMLMPYTGCYSENGEKLRKRLGASF